MNLKDFFLLVISVLILIMLLVNFFEIKKIENILDLYDIDKSEYCYGLD